MKILIVNHHFAGQPNNMTVHSIEDDEDSEKYVDGWMHHVINTDYPNNENVEFYIDEVIELLDVGPNFSWGYTDIKNSFERYERLEEEKVPEDPSVRAARLKDYGLSDTTISTIIKEDDS